MRQSTLEALENEREQTRANLKSTKEQLAFDAQTKRLHQEAVQRTGTHAESQWKDWAKSVNASTAGQWSAVLSRQPNDPDTVVEATGKIVDSYVKTAELHGAQPGDNVWTQARDAGRTAALKTRIDAIAVDDPAGASKLADKYKDILATQYDEVAQKLRARSDHVNGPVIADDVMGRGPAQGRSQQIIQKFEAAGYTHEQAAAAAGHIYHESGNNPNAVHDGGIGLGIAGWNGDRLENLKKFAADRGKPVNDFDTQVDFAIHELDHGEARAGAALKGARSVTDATTAFMHYERPRGYTPDTPQAGDAYAQRLSNAAKFAQGNFSGLPDKATTFERILDRTQGNPGLQQAALAHANRVYSIYHSDNVQQSAAFKANVNDDIAQAHRTGGVQQPKTELDFISTLGPEQGPGAYRQYQSELTLGADINSVAGMSMAEQDALVKKYEPMPGPGFAAAATRHDVLAKAVNAVRAERVKDPHFKARIDNSITEASRTGNATNPVPREEFVERLGEEAGTAAFEQYSASLKLGKDVQGLGGMSPMDRAKLRDLYTPEAGEQYIEQSKRADQLDKAIAAVEKEKQSDPAGFASERLPVVAQAQSKLIQTLADPKAKPEDRNAAARNYAEITLAEQDRVGIPRASQRILPKFFVDNLNGELATVADNPDPAARGNLVQKIRDQAAIWGEHWPEVMRQMAPASQPIIRAIAAGADPTAMQRLLSAGSEKPGQVIKEQNEVKAADIRSKLNDAMAPFKRSMVGQQKERDYDSYYGLGEKLAALYVRDGDDAATASDKAFKALIGNRYDFRDTYRIPKSPGVPAADDIQAGAEAARLLMRQSSREAGGNPLNLAPAQNDIHLDDNRLDSFSKYARDGRWVTSYDNSGLNLVYDTIGRNEGLPGTKFIRTADGQPLHLTWAKLAELGGTPASRRAIMQQNATTGLALP